MNDSSRIIPIIKIKLNGFNGSPCFDTLESALEELRDLIKDELLFGGDVENNQTITISFMNMTREAYENIPEFEGY